MRHAAESNADLPELLGRGRVEGGQNGGTQDQPPGQFHFQAAVHANKDGAIVHHDVPTSGRATLADESSASGQGAPNT